MADLNRIGELLQARRKALGLTQPEVAAATGAVSLRTFKRIEGGHPGMGLDDLVAICGVLGVPAWEVLRDALSPDARTLEAAERDAQALKVKTLEERLALAMRVISGLEAEIAQAQFTHAVPAECDRIKWRGKTVNLTTVAYGGQGESAEGAAAC